MNNVLLSLAGGERVSFCERFARLAAVPEFFARNNAVFQVSLSVGSLKVLDGEWEKRFDNCFTV